MSLQLCVKRIKTNKPSNYSTVDQRNKRTHKHTRLISASISFLILFQSFTFNTPKLMRMPGRLRWSGNGCVPCHAPFYYIIYLHSACGGALRGWNINTNEVAGLTTQTQHLYWAWTLICTTVNTCLTGVPGLLGSSSPVCSESDSQEDADDVGVCTHDLKSEKQVRKGVEAWVVSPIRLTTSLNWDHIKSFYLFSSPGAAADSFQSAGEERICQVCTLQHCHTRRLFWFFLFCFFFVTFKVTTHCQRQQQQLQ